MDRRELLIYEELLGKLKRGNEDQIYILKKEMDKQQLEIHKLKNEIEKRKKNDLIKQIYEEFRLCENNISLNSFRNELYTLRNQG